MRVALSIFTVILLSFAALAQSPRASLKAGDKAPDFSLPNGDDQQVKLSDYTARGPVVLIFYRGFW